MKKILFTFMTLVLSLAFFACSDEKDLTGSADLTIGKETYHMPVASYTSADGKTVIVGTNVSQTVNVDFKGTEVRKYVIGYGDNFKALTSNHPFAEDFSPEANVSFVSTVNERKEVTVVCGVLTVTEYNSDSIVAVFSGEGLDKATANSLITGNSDPEAVEQQLEKISGCVVAVPQKKEQE